MYTLSLASKLLSLLTNNNVWADPWNIIDWCHTLSYCLFCHKSIPDEGISLSNQSKLGCASNSCHRMFSLQVEIFPPWVGMVTIWVVSSLVNGSPSLGTDCWQDQSKPWPNIGRDWLTLETSVLELTAFKELSPVSMMPSITKDVCVDTGGTWLISSLGFIGGLHKFISIEHRLCNRRIE